MVNPPRYFSARALKMSFQFEVTTVEYVMDEVAKSLDLNPNRFGLLATLLGNHILTAQDLEDFHGKLAPEVKDPKYKVGFERVIRAVVNYIRTLPKLDDFEQIGKDVFGSPGDVRIKKLRASLQYYTSCTQEGYIKHKPKFNKKKKQLHLGSIKFIADSEKSQPNLATQAKSKKLAEPSASHTDLVERIALDLDQLDLNEAISVATKAMKENSAMGMKPGPSGDGPAPNQGRVDEVEKTELSVVQALALGVDVAPSEEGKYPGKKEPVPQPNSLKPICIPDIHPEVFRTALERHRQSQMSPYVYQLITRGEIKLPVLLEDCKAADGIPPIHQLFQPLRQCVYAVIFNLNHQKFNRKQLEEGIKMNRRKADELRKQAKKSKSEEEKKELTSKAESLMKQAAEVKEPDQVEIRVREWLPYNDYEIPETVEAVDIPWSVPTIQRLWFGSSVEDKQKRLRAFLSCLRCDDCPPLLTHSNVPQHMLLLACVLRYITTSSAFAVLRKPEMDALLATAFSPELRNTRYLAEMKVDLITKRGVQLATMINQGIEMAIMANDACGAPIPFQMCLPWSFFDGKLFHSKLRRADVARNLMELCDGRMEIVYAIERMRAAILHGLVPQYGNAVATNSTPTFVGGGRGRGTGGIPPVMASGGRLVVGGAVVGQWGANYGSSRRQGAAGVPQQRKKKPKKQLSGMKSKSAGRGITVVTQEGSSVLAATLVSEASGDAVFVTNTE